LRSFWARYVQARLLGADDIPFGAAPEIFEEPILGRMRQRFQEEALQTPVFFTERLSNRILAVCIRLQSGTNIIGINARLRVDPELMAHALIEEFAHAQQLVDGVDIEVQQHQFEYHERSYEREAKAIATEILGYEPEPYEALLIRDEGEDILR
jgi:Zn-dependent peptidase ImmA (M78 family)